MRLVKNSIDDIDFPRDWCLRSKSNNSKISLVYVTFSEQVTSGISYIHEDENCIVFCFEI